MILVVQRVTMACVRVGGREVSRVGRGLLVLAAVERGDGPAEADWCGRKIADLRIFSDAEGKMNLSVRDVGGSVLAVSQFTLAGDLRKGTRPSFTGAAAPGQAEPLFDRMAAAVEAAGVPVAKGIFGAMMAVELVNDGPVTLVITRRPGSADGGSAG